MSILVNLCTLISEYSSVISESLAICFQLLSSKISSTDDDGQWPSMTNYWMDANMHAKHKGLSGVFWVIKNLDSTGFQDVVGNLIQADFVKSIFHQTTAGNAQGSISMHFMAIDQSWTFGGPF